MQSSQDGYVQAAQEDRCAPRTKIAIPAQLRVSGARAFRTVVHDLSFAGFSASAIGRLQPEQICWLTLPGLQSIEGRVVWWDRSIAGVAFHNMIDPIVLDDLLARWASPLGGGVTRSCLM
ncbi:MAG: PilZ domain-containing protein [Erythrobacter sp.]|nr:PilZ domain-containing protein [Erythrobacter sp.]NCQ63852.1 PilZ domain-containing protein [Alphaproteobacteria bacterium]